MSVLVEFVGGPWDGELREMEDDAPVILSRPPRLTLAQAERINLRQFRYEWDGSYSNGARRFVWQGEVDPGPFAPDAEGAP